MISFYSILPFGLGQEAEVTDWLLNVAARYGRTVESLEYVFVDDAYLHRMNLDHLGHDTLTDIITFDYSVSASIVGEIYISVERVQDNAQDLSIPFIDELHRVLVHGLLHICGMSDGTSDQEREMRLAEDLSLGLRMF
ncbi:MAG: rRNA maturation RNase YbeY [Bacteroidetes bacterium]|jgi:probable rRNA maturation factor|nr:rRNA maturation RNase YbeY [Bacteroidota bacterium]